MWVKNNSSNNSKSTVDGGGSGQSVWYYFALICSDFGLSRWKGCLNTGAGLSRCAVPGTVSIGAHLSGWYSPQTDGRTDGSSFHINCLFLFRKERRMFEVPSGDKASTCTWTLHNKSFVLLFIFQLSLSYNSQLQCTIQQSIKTLHLAYTIVDPWPPRAAPSQLYLHCWSQLHTDIEQKLASVGQQP